MTLRTVFAGLLVAALAGAPPAGASFSAPVQLAGAHFSVAAAAATDAAGQTTAVVTGAGAPRLLERPAGAPWPAPARLPGDPRGMKGPVVAAAGQGALGVAWRVDTPRKYTAIQVALRDPGGALSTPIVVAGSDAGGVRHPALALDPAGDALLAFNAHTRKTHLSQQGAVAVAYRPARGAFGRPVVVDRDPSSPPAVALAPDGTGIVAWTHNRRVYAVSIERGEVGRAKALGGSSGLRSVVAAAGPGGAATIAWVGLDRGDHRYEVRALRRAPGRAFGPVRVTRTKAFIPELVLAADERGQTTAAWAEDDFDHPAGDNGITSSVHAATAAPGGGFGKPRALTPQGTRFSQSLSIAAANGRVALAWGYKRDSRHIGVHATVGPANALGPPQTLAAATLVGDLYVMTPSARVTLSPAGAATVLAVVPSEPDPKQVTSLLLAADGP
jgi:hypothetical protein